MLVASKRWIDPQVIAAVHDTAALLAKLGHQVEDADVDLGGLEVVFRVMVDAENAAIKAESLEQFSDPYTRWCRASGARKSAADYIRAAEVMFGAAGRSSHSRPNGISCGSHHHRSTAAARNLPLRRRADG